MPKRLYLVRHGETEANYFKIIEGRGTDASPEYGNPLNRSGLLQARLLGCALAEVKIDHVYISPARRAIETANQICIYHWTRVRNMLLITLKSSLNKELAEINFGFLEGCNGKKAQEKWPDLFKIYHKKPSQTVFPGGESVVQAYRRIGCAINKILAAHTHNENILIVSHGGVMAFILIHIFKLDLDTMFHAIRHHNCGLSIIEWEKPDSPKIICLNDISHLESEQAQRLKEPLSPFLSD